HPRSGSGEAVMPIYLFAQKSADEGAENGTEVDAHVIKRIACIPPCIVMRCVKLPHKAAHGGFQKSCAKHDKYKAEIKSGSRRKRHGEMAKGDDDAAIKHGILQPQQ